MSNKELILQTALKLFGEQGYERTPTSAIAKAAGVSQGLLFLHYANKAGLLEAILREGLAQIAETMRPYEAAQDPRAAIVQHIEQALNAIREHALFWRLATQMRFQPAVQESAAAQIGFVNKFIIDQLTENFDRLGAARPDLEALHLFAEIDGVCLHWLQNPAQYPLDEMKQFLIQKYLL
jgi:AcrR family transcriptional regulator